MEPTPTLSDIINDYPFIEFLDTDLDLPYGDCTDTRQVKGFIDQRIGDEE